MGAFSSTFAYLAPGGLPKRKNLVIYFGGQSNEGTDPATGQVAASTMPAHLKNAYTNVWFWDIAMGNTNAFALYSPGSNAMGWIDQTLYILSQVYERVYVIKRALGGTNLATVGQGSSYPRSDFKNRSTAGKTAVDTILGGPTTYDAINLWGQCESDGANSTDAANYQANLTYWIDTEYRGTIVDNIWIIKRLSNTTKDFTYRATVAAGQNAVVAADTRKKIIDTDNLRHKGTNTRTGVTGSGDFSHYNATSAIVVGTRFAEAVLRTFNRVKTDTTAPVIQSAVINSAGTLLTLTYNETLNPGIAPFWKHFTVGTKVFSSVVINGSTVELTPTVPFYAGVTYTLSYTKNTVFNENLQDLQGNEVADLVNYAITNNASSTEPTISTLYTGNFSAGLDGTWAGFSGGAAAAPFTSPSGETDCAKVTIASTNGRFYKFTTSGVTSGVTIRMKFRIEVPDTFSFPANPSSLFISLAMASNAITAIPLETLVVRDQMTYIEVQFTPSVATDDIYFDIGTSISNDVFYVKDIIIQKVG